MSKTRFTPPDSVLQPAPYPRLVLHPSLRRLPSFQQCVLTFQTPLRLPAMARTAIVAAAPAGHPSVTSRPVQGPSVSPSPGQALDIKWSMTKIAVKLQSLMTEELVYLVPTTSPGKADGLQGIAVRPYSLHVCTYHMRWRCAMSDCTLGCYRLFETQLAR